MSANDIRELENLDRIPEEEGGDCAAALVNEPEVILLDEPTSALDPMGRYELMEILNNLKDGGKSILLSTHILADMEKVVRGK